MNKTIFLLVFFLCSLVLSSMTQAQKVIIFLGDNMAEPEAEFVKATVEIERA